MLLPKRIQVVVLLLLMPNSPYDSKDFKALKKQWYKKAADSGFKDLEDDKENLDPGLTHNTIAWQNREVIRDFFLKLDAYIGSKPSIPAIHSEILTMYSQGINASSKNGIADKVQLHPRSVRRIIKHYKEKLLKDI